jgi:lysophospholipase L1-like esterase
MLGLCCGSVISFNALGKDSIRDRQYPHLAAFEQQMKAGKHLSVAYLGGSITWGACATDQGKTSYRALVSAFLERQYPEAHLKFWDAAIGGTPSKLGVFRMDRDVLPYKPNLTFVEFAVNDGNMPESVETMEGIIRKLRNSNPKMAIVIVVVGAGKQQKYGTSKHQEHIKLAEYYGLPYADVCGPVKAAIKAGKIDTDVILADGCHPCDTGYRLYADLITDSLQKAFAAKGKATRYPQKPLTANRYETAKMLELAKLADLGDWQAAQPATLGTWYDHQPSRWISSIITPKKDNAELTVKLACSGVGLYYEILQKGEPILVEVDGKQIYKISTAMSQHYGRIAWKFDQFAESASPHKITLRAPKKDHTRAAYILYTQNND